MRGIAWLRLSLDGRLSLRYVLGRRNCRCVMAGGSSLEMASVLGWPYFPEVSPGTSFCVSVPSTSPGWLSVVDPPASICVQRASTLTVTGPLLVAYLRSSFLFAHQFQILPQRFVRKSYSAARCLRVLIKPPSPPSSSSRAPLPVFLRLFSPLFMMASSPELS